MAYQISIQNNQITFGKLLFDVILTDDAGILPTIRIPRKYPAGTVINPAFRAAEKAKLIAIVTADRIRTKYITKRDDAKQQAIDIALNSSAYINAIAKIDQDEQDDLQAAGVN